VFFIISDLIEAQIDAYNKKHPKKPWTKDYNPPWIKMEPIRKQADDIVKQIEEE
jgi:hypothetical protein